jgi:hypothetical protein
MKFLVIAAAAAVAVWAGKRLLARRRGSHAAPPPRRPPLSDLADQLGGPDSPRATILGAYQPGFVGAPGEVITLQPVQQRRRLSPLRQDHRRARRRLLDRLRPPPVVEPIRCPQAPGFYRLREASASRCEALRAQAGTRWGSRQVHARGVNRPIWRSTHQQETCRVHSNLWSTPCKSPGYCSRCCSYLLPL